MHMLVVGHVKDVINGLLFHIGIFNRLIAYLRNSAKEEIHVRYIEPYWGDDISVALLSMIFNVQKTYIEYTSNTNYSAFCIFKNLTNLSRNFKEFQRVSKKYSRRKFCSRNC